MYSVVNTASSPIVTLHHVVDKGKPQATNHSGATYIKILTQQSTYSKISVLIHVRVLTVETPDDGQLVRESTRSRNANRVRYG